MVAWEALNALSHQLELCKMSADTRVVVVLDAAVNAERTSLIRAAVARTGASAIEVRVIDTRAGSDNNDLLTAAAEVADVVIVTSSETRAQVGDGSHQILELPAVAPHAFPPHANLRRRVRKLGDLVASAQMLQLSDGNGTNLSVDLSGGESSFDHGVLTAEERRAKFPAGWVAVSPAARSVNGDLVLMPGDGNRNAQRLISSPVLLRIIDDHISAIDGDNADADVLRSQLEYADDPAAFGVAEICVGMNPGAVAAGPFDDRLLDPVVGRLLAGVVGISFGHNPHAHRPCSQRIAITLRNRTVTIDDLPVVVAGTLDGDFAPDVYEL